MSQYGSFGIAGERLWVKPGRLRGVVIGEFNTGKTSFLASNPAALIINLDLSSTPVPSIDSPPLPAQFWPGLNPEGQPIGFNRQVIKLDLDAVKGLVGQLEEAAAKNLPRPETIVIDSVSELLSLIKLAALKQFGKNDKPLNSWDEGRGDAMWEWVYNQYLSIVDRLRAAGYGCWVVAHITQETIEDESSKRVVKWSLTTPPGWYKRFYGGFEAALQLEKTFDVRQITKVKKVTVDGKIIEMPEITAEKVAMFTLVGESSSMSALYKRRVCFPARLTVPPVGAWAAFEAEYLKVAKPPAT